MNAGAQIAVSHRHRRGRRRRGTSALEFALVGPWLFLLILGILEIGRGFMVTHALAAAARQVCRQAVVRPTTSTSQVQADVHTALAAWGVGGETTRVLVNGVEADASTAISDNRVTVTVSVPLANVVYLPYLPRGHNAGNLSGQYTLRKE